MAASGPSLLAEGARVAVVGGGLAGLTAAWRLLERRPDLRVLVLEASASNGGKLALGEVAGVTVDVGAESILARRPEALDLARSLGLGEDLVHPDTLAARIWTRGALRPMPPTVMGVPADLRALAESGIVSRRGRARARLDQWLPASEVGEDVSVGDLVARRLGGEVLDRLVEPLLGGVYAGHARQLSARATVPQVVALLDRGRSLLRAAGEATAQRTMQGPVFAGLRGGVGQLPIALTTAVTGGGGVVRTGATVRGLARSESGWRLLVGPTVAEEAVELDAVVVATPAPASARLLDAAVPEAARLLAEIETASMAVITVAVRPGDLPGASGSGFLVPPVEGRSVKAATWSFAKWGWVREAGDAEGVHLWRCSVGRLGEEHVLQRTDEELVALARAELAEAAGLRGTPVAADVQRWGGSLPQYAVGHIPRTVAIREAVARQRGLAVCGAAYDGLGIPAVIASADRAVDALLGPTPSGLGGPAQ